MIKFNLDGHEPSFLPEGKEWKLIWNDEFDGKELDRTKWTFRLDFWGRKFQTYTNEGIEFDGNSNLKINLVEKDGQYYSAQLQTGFNSFDTPKETQVNPWGHREIWPLADIKEPLFMHRYGYYEVRCKQPTQEGWWSAFWLQSPSIGTTYDPTYSGIECDIMECFKRDGEVTSGNIFGGYGNQYKRDARIHYNIENPEDFHRFGVYWNEEGYIFYCDGKETVRTNKYVSKVEQFILLTTECQGYRSGNMDQPREDLKKAVLPDCFTVDYVRVFDEVK